MEKSKNPHRIKARMLSGFTTLLLLVAVVICLSVVLQSMSHGYVSVFGTSLFRVVTGSMEPTIPVDAVLLAREVDIQEVRENEIVCFVSTNPGSSGVVVTHRVVGVYDTPDGVRCLRTKGDHNLSVDVNPVTQQNLIGRVVWHTGDESMMAKIVSFLTGEYGFLACIVLPVLLIAVWIFRDAAKSIKKEIQSVEERLQRDERARRKPQAPALTDAEYEEMVQRIKNEVRKEMEQHAEPVEQADHPLAAAPSDDTAPADGE